MVQLTKDIIWLAGLLEGEGYFGLSEGKYPKIALGMTDEDIIVRASALINARVCRQKNMWITQVNGAYAIQWMMTLYTLLGKRRRECIREIIKVWKERIHAKASNGMRNMATCHPALLVHGYGLCRPCYMKQYYYREKEKQLLRRIG